VQSGPSRTTGRPIIKSVATRWFNTVTDVTQTAGDLWIHRQREELWWTVSEDKPPDWEEMDDPAPLDGPTRIFVGYKPCKPWSQKNQHGSALQWSGLHPKAREFLFTESTCQKLSTDYALYAQSLINGDDLSAWHHQSAWKAKEAKAGKGAVKVFNPLERTAARLAETAWDTCQQSGQVSTTVAKTKLFGFNTQFELENHVKELCQQQEGLCALTGLAMVPDGTDGDAECSYSLDRIDSNGHYARGNLQVVCKFANRWKSASDNEEFKRLIEMVRADVTANQ
jgi:hypothetical protein